jgi:hypothetical protein
LKNGFAARGISLFAASHISKPDGEKHTMSQEGRGRDLFIVDNSVSGWTGLRYLEEWTGIAKAFDIATGYSGFQRACQWLTLGEYMALADQM